MFRTQTPKSTSMFCNCLAICFPPSSRLSRNIGEFRVKKYFTDHRRANTILLVFAIKGSFSEQVAVKRSSPGTS